jgi:predicted glutamine amidotransferase
MCGIVYGANFQGYPVNKKILRQFQSQRSRGIEGFGLFDGQYKNIVRTPKERKIKSWLKNHPTNEIMFHHRYPTSTDNVKNACHPFSSRDFFGKNKNYVLVHNGMLWNADELKAEHEKLGIEYYSVQPDGRFNDSEALMWDVALYLEGKQDRLHAYGSIAFICIAKRGKKESLFFGRNSSPLKMASTEHSLFLASELKHKRAEDIDANHLYEFDYETRLITKEPLVVPSDHYEAEGIERPVSTTTYGASSGYHQQHLPYADNTGNKRTPDGSGAFDFWDEEEQRWDSFDPDYDSDEKWELAVINEMNRQAAPFVSEHPELPPPFVYNSQKKASDPSDVEVLDTLKATDNPEDMKRDVQTLYRGYMNWAKGAFQVAMSMAESDQEILRDQLSDMRLQLFNFNQVEHSSINSSIRDLEYQLQLQEAVIDIILMNPMWSTVDAVDKTYAEDDSFDWTKMVKTSVKRFLSA